MSFQVGYKKPPSNTLYWFIGVASALGVFTAWYFHIEPVYGYINPVIAGIGNLVQTYIIIPLSPLLPNLGNLINQNPQTAIAIGSAALFPLGTAIYKIYSDRKVAQANLQMQQAQESAINSSNEIGKLQAKLKELESTPKTVLTDNAEEFAEIQKALTSKNTTIEKLTSQVQILSQTKNPSVQDMVEILRKEGYEVIKKLSIP
jgi:hypothetical protein